MNTELKRETQGRTRLILTKLDSPRRRADKKLAHYVIDVHYLSPSGGVQGNDYGLFTRSEVKDVIDSDKSLFDITELN